MKRKHDANDMNSQQASQLQARVNNGRGNTASNGSNNGSSNLNGAGNTQNSSDSSKFENHCSLNNNGMINNNNNNNGSNRNDNNSNNQRTQQKRICREFVKGSCRRLQCRYPHVMSADQIIFCHDFQNTSCIRTNCKFLHYTLEEEDYYVMHGEFPTEKAKEFSRQMPPKMAQSYEGSYDGCTMGYDRPSSLLCRHRNCSSDRHAVQMPSPNLSGRIQVPPNLRSQSNSPPIPWNDFQNRQSYRSNDQRHHLISNSEYRNGYCNDYQFGNGYMSQQSAVGGQINNFQRTQLQEDKNRMTQSHQASHECSLRQRSLEEVVNMLRCRIEVAELTVAEVRATNEYLLTQMRLNKMQQQCSQCSSTVVVNPVTVTQTTSQPQTAQVIGAVSMAPVQVQASPIVSIATPQTQIITNNAAAPLAIATNTSQGQQLAIAQQNITSLSNTTQPLGGTHPQQILGTSQITLAPAIGNGPSMGLTINTSQALAMSNATQPIISYPVMTHSILPH